MDSRGVKVSRWRVVVARNLMSRVVVVGARVVVVVVVVVVGAGVVVVVGAGVSKKMKNTLVAYSL